MHEHEGVTTKALIRFKQNHAPEILPVQIQAARYIDAHMSDSPDEAHRNDHNAQLFDDASTMFDRDPALRPQIHAGRFADYVLSHDIFRSSIRWLNPISFVLGQFGEAYFARGPAVKFFRRYGYDEKRLNDIGDVVAVHALSPYDKRSKALPPDPTRFLFNNVDNMSVLSNKRVKQMIRYLYRSFGKLPVQLALPALARNFERNTAGFTYNFDVIRDEARIRREKTLRFVNVLGNRGRRHTGKDRA